MIPGWKGWTLLVVGWGFVVLGILGLFLPVLQGILFLAIGGAILSRQSPWFRGRAKTVRRRYPRAARRWDALAGEAHRRAEPILRRFRKATR